MTTVKLQGIPFRKTPNDPIQLLEHELSNGMKVVLSINRDEPKIYTNLLVKAGSKHDPADATGLAHYLEHMMFKGTSKIGALDFEKEKILLDKIAGLYEKHRQASAKEERLQIYKEIDRLSNEAANLVVPNEYDRLASTIGADKTNAYTWLEQTVYVNEIPSNELERWMQLEAERFREVVLRLFHTELETVYEEFNIGQDNDHRKIGKKINEALFPSHPYARPTIGKGEHLKSPSMKRIYEFFDTYYRPNNMVLVLAGDLDPAATIGLAEKYFGQLKPEATPQFSFEEQPPLKEVARVDVFGQEAGYVRLAWRFEGASSDQIPMLYLLQGLLFNQNAGLMDLNLLKKQLLLEAAAVAEIHRDYSIFHLYGKQREGQSHQDVENLLIEQLEKIKNLDYDHRLHEAVIRDYKLKRLKAFESNMGRVNAVTEAATLGLEWEQLLDWYDQMAQITPGQMAGFVREHFAQNYVAAYKHTGEDPAVMKVEKPPITPVEVNREDKSEFHRQFLQFQSPNIQPSFVDFNKAIKKTKLDSGVTVQFVKNPYNPTFTLTYVFEMGKIASRRLKLALSYLEYAGTGKFSAEELQFEFFRLGLSFSAWASNKMSFIKLEGVEESLEKGVQLLEHLLSDARGDDKSWQAFISDVFKQRENNKKNKHYILRHGMVNYGYYGPASPFNYLLSEQELRSIRHEEMTDLIHGLFAYEHHVNYYGALPQEDVTGIQNRHHKTAPAPKPLIPNKTFTEVPTTEDKVFFVHYPMVQTELLMMSRGTEGFDPDEYVMGELWNEYFGIGMTGIVFQEIRESKGLAYSTYAYYRKPSEPEDASYIQAFVGTQPDKLEEAVATLRAIIDDMPVNKQAIEQVRQALIKKMAAARIKPRQIFRKARAHRKLGLNYNLNEHLYQALQNITPEDFIRFQQEKIKGRNFSFLLLGDENNLDPNLLKSIGKVQKLNLKDVFGY